jgi:molecular chaperone DnaK
MVTDNKLLGQFDLVGLPPAPRGIPQIEVTFDIDANGIVHVGAKDLGTGKEQSVKITATTNLTESEIEKMRKDSEQYSAEDKKRREEAETINSADTLIYTSEKLFKDFEGKVDSKEIESVKEEIEGLKKLMETADQGSAGSSKSDSMKEEKRDASAIKKKMEEINQKIQALSTELYKKASEEQAKKQGQAHGQSQQSNAAGEDDDDSSQSGPAAGADDVVDAEFEEVKDDDKKSKKK